MDMRELQSSHIHSVGYDLEKRTLRVRFHDYRRKRDSTTVPGGVIELDDFDQGDYESFMAAANDPDRSAGAHFAKHIRGLPHRRIESDG
jgi:KTSC domain-containing protein